MMRTMWSLRGDAPPCCKPALSLLVLNGDMMIMVVWVMMKMVMVWC